MTRLLVVYSVVIFGIAPAVADKPTTEYYVVHEAATNKCAVVDVKPTTIAKRIVGDKSFKSISEAHMGMKTFKICSNSSSPSEF